MSNPSRWPDLPDAFRHFSSIAGVDEVGRGPLAGPVVAAAVILPADLALDSPDLAGLGDSKTVPPARRKALALALLRVARVGIAYVPADMIDKLNIRAASQLAMNRALKALPIVPDAALIDGRDVPPGINIPAMAVIRGDSRIAAISAASIIAKVARDTMMDQSSVLYPAYSFEKNSGYPTRHHRDAIRAYGLCPLHRLSFGPCKPGSV